VGEKRSIITFLSVLFLWPPDSTKKIITSVEKNMEFHNWQGLRQQRIFYVWQKTYKRLNAKHHLVVPSEEVLPYYKPSSAPMHGADKDYFFDKKKVQLFFTLEFHAAVRGE
jgi:hypothetical protein